MLLICAAAIYAGLWPSLLTLGALFALPLGAVALIGEFSPRALLARPRLLRFARVGTYVLAAEFVLLGARSVWSQRRHVTLIVHEPVPPALRVVYQVTDGSPRAFRWNRRHEIPASGVLHSQYAMDLGWYRPEDPHPLTVLVVSSAGDTSDVAGHWRLGGFTSADGCRFFFDEYAVGPAPAAAEFELGVRPATWMDYLPEWGVVCDAGRVRRSREGEQASGGPQPAFCVYQRSGGMSCPGGSPAP